MGSRWVGAAVMIMVALMLVPQGGAAQQGPVVFAVGWGAVSEQFFPHPSLCVGDASVDRQRAAGPGYHFDPDGCTGEEAVLAFADKDGSGGPSAEDPHYLQPRGSPQVSAGDLRISSSAPVALKASDADTGLRVHHASGQWDFVDVDRDGRWSAPDTAYFDPDKSGGVSPGDFELATDLRRLPLGTTGMFYALQAAIAGLCFVDDDGSGAWNAGEPAYLVLGRPCDQVRPGDLRIVATRGQQPGSRVIEAAFDYRNPLTAFPAPQGAPAVADGIAYLDLDGSGTVTEADRFIVGLRPVQVATDASLSTGGVWAFLDLDGDGVAGESDLIYIDRDENGRTSEGDVRLHRLAGQTFGSVVAAGDLDDVAALPAKQGPAGDAEEASEGSAGKAKKTPGPALVPVLLAVLGLLARARRPQE